MNIEEQIQNYINALTGTKGSEMQDLHRRILQLCPSCQLWFLDGRDEKGKVVSNPNIGYGYQVMKYADGSTREFYKIGLSANKSGLSIYILGTSDKKYLAQTFGEKLGKASVIGYCTKFKTLKVINLEILESAIRYGFDI